ncbi:MAG TPA: DUF2062 domain-containing protein [Burkholderiales bacterium]|jgi:uncharacterized protein (DUF2062 family)|nr:DUF2062 domain-containing protein [Burkholderiales bacterium]
MRFIRRHLPHPDSVRSHKYLAWCGDWLKHPNLWALNRDSVAGGFAIGLAAGLVPGPLQMLSAALLAIPLKRNLPVAVATTLYTNPLTIGPLYVLAYGYGRLLLGASGNAAAVEPFDWNWSDWLGSAEALLHWTISLGKPLAIGLPALALTLAAVGYFAVQIAWRAYVVLAWRSRRHRRKRTRPRT